MAGELAYDPTTGRLVYSPATGQLAKDCDADTCPDIDCPAGVGEKCPDCEDDGRGPTPDSYTLTILTEPTLCDECFDVSARDDYADSVKLTATNLAGTYELEQSGTDNCCWRGEGGTVDVDMWRSSTTCTGTPDKSWTWPNSAGMALEALSDGSFHLSVWIEFDGAVLLLMSLTWTPDCCADDSHDYVTDDASDYESTDCGNTDDLNDCAPASFGDGPIAAYDGTLKVEACYS